MATVTKGRTFVSGETVTPAKLNELVDSATVTAIQTADISDSQITTAKIADSAVTDAKIASGVDASKLTTGTLPIARIADASVTQAKLASNVATTGPAFRAYANSVTAVASGVETKITLGAEDFDTANCFSSSRFTPNVAGYYWISAAIRCENLLAANVVLYKNGARHSWGTNANAGTYHSHVSDLIYLNGTTDYVELYAYQGSAGTQNMATQLFSPVSAYTWMSGFLARAA